MSRSFSVETYKGIIDSHFHTESMLQRGMDVFSIYNELFEAGFEGGIDIGCVHDDLPRRQNLLSPYPKILLSGAMGPWEAGKSETKETDVEAEFSNFKSIETLERELGKLKENLRLHKARFIGEIGLDYYWDYGTHEKQKLLFETQMGWADEMGLCVLIHDRDADCDITDAISRLGPSKGGVIHCFDGSELVLKTALDKGYYISFAGNLTYKSNENLRQVLKKVPLDRLLLETDSPYLTPVPLRGKPNSPEKIIHTYECAAQVLDLGLDELKAIVLRNFNDFAKR